MAMLEDTPSPQDIKLTSTIEVEAPSGTQAKVTIPEELRITEGLLKLISDALSAQGLQLQHMDIAEVHKKDLEGLPNVILDENKESEEQ